MQCTSGSEILSPFMVVFYMLCVFHEDCLQLTNNQIMIYKYEYGSYYDLVRLDRRQELNDTHAN